MEAYENAGPFDSVVWHTFECPKCQALPQDDGTTITTLLRDVREAAIALKGVMGSS